MSASLMGDNTIIFMLIQVLHFVIILRCNKSKEMAMKSGNVKTGGNALFIVISLSFLFQYK